MQLIFSLKNTKALAFKTDKKYELLKQRVHLLILPRKKEINDFEKTIDLKTQHLLCNIKAYIPENKIFSKKDGAISSLKGDDLAQAQIIKEIIFGHFNYLDEKLICNTHFEQVVSPDNQWHINFVLKKRENEHLYET